MTSEEAPRRSALLRLRRWAMHRIHRQLGGNPPPLRVVFWDGETFDFAAHPSVTITVRSPAIVRMLLLGNFAPLGDAYVAGELTVDGRIQDILRVGIDRAYKPTASGTAPRRWTRGASIFRICGPAAGAWLGLAVIY